MSHPDNRLSTIASRLHQNLVDLYDIATMLSPAVAAFDSTKRDLEFIVSTLPLTDAEQSELDNLLRSEFELSESRRVRFGFAGQTLVDQSAEAIGRSLETEDETGTRTQIPPSLLQFLADHHCLASFAETLQRHQIRFVGSMWFNRSLVSYAVNVFEAGLSDLVAAFYTRHPKALHGLKDRAIALAEVLSFETMADLTEAIVDQQVRTFMAGSLEDWSQWMDRYLKEEWRSLAFDWSQTVEVFQRRHVIVHNDGKVSRLYLKNVNFEKDPPTIGTVLPVPNSYVLSALDRLYALGALSLLLALLKDKDETETAGRLAVQGSYLLLKIGRTGLVAHLAGALKGRGLTREHEAMIQVNGWIARKAIGDPTIPQELEAWDISGLELKFQIAKPVLLEKYDEAVPLLRSALRGGGVEWESAKVWPLFQWFRNEAAYLELAEEFKGPKNQGATGSP